MPRSLRLTICVYGLVVSLAYGGGVTDVGPKIYQTRCAICHGEKGDGRGPAAPSLNPKPTDFTSGLYKYRSTAWGSPPTDSDLERTIRAGLNGTAMPGWGDLLSAEEVRALIEALKAFSPSTFKAKAAPVRLPPPSLFQGADPDVGKTLYVQKGCATCHRTEGRGEGHPIRPRDLTDRRNYRWGASLQDIYLRIATGLNGTPMEGYAGRMSPEEISHLSAYLSSLSEAAEKSRWMERGDQMSPVQRGEYLVSVMTCRLCHTPVNLDASYREDVHLAGGMKVTSFPDGIYYSRNLTPDRESGLGEWSLDAVKRAITRGTATNSRLLYPFDMPWLFFSSLTDQDAEAIAVYLKSLKPIYNKVPPPEPAGFWDSVANKLRLLFGRERTLEYHAGNSGERSPGKGHAIPPATQGFWSLLPPLGWVPVEIVLQAAKPDLPMPAQTGSVQEDAKRMRGRYLVSIAPCGLCHTAVQGGVWPGMSVALSGGGKISFGGPYGFGTVYARNLTSDHETGLGSWTDQQIKLAIQRGVTKEGRQMHWQAMPWDIYSNFTEADLEAMVAYLRSLPPVRKAIPSPTPDAPPGYRVYLGRDYGVAKEKR